MSEMAMLTTITGESPELPGAIEESQALVGFGAIALPRVL
jgi:hypothetical protein